MRYFIYCRKSSEAEDRQVLSIDSQLSTLRQTFGGRSDIEIVEVLQEAFSAKSPGRPQFDEMIKRVRKGEAEGIVAWAPDRLARNSIDGGQIIYLLDQGRLLDLKFATYTFENNSQGKFMLQIMFGQSKYYSDALSENVKRGNRTKLELGWRPNNAPLGYLNESNTKTIIKDPVYFPLVRSIFELMLTGAYSPKQIAITSRDQWGFRTPKKKRGGDVPIAMSTIYKILSNPFYAGLIRWNGEIYPGRHEPIISVAEFEQVARLLGRSNRRRSQRHDFAFTGMIRCGACGLTVTAEHKINRFGSRYVYYHCSKSRLTRCSQPSVEEKKLLHQIEAFIRRLTIHPRIHDWIVKELEEEAYRHTENREARQVSLKKAIAGVKVQLNELTGLRLRNVISDEEFTNSRNKLKLEELRLAEGIQDVCNAVVFEPLSSLVSFSSRAIDWFSRGENQIKRLILETVASNLFLKDKILSIEAAKPFYIYSQTASSSQLLGVVKDLRTLAENNDPEFCRAVKNIRLLEERFGLKVETGRRAA